MSIELRAPFSGPTVILLLPSPVLQNEEAAEQSVNHRLAMDGTNYTYVKRSLYRRLTLSFENQGRGKIVEIEEFYRFFSAEHIRLIDWRGDEWDVVFEEDPLEFTTNGRNTPGDGARGERGSFELVLIGTKL